MFDRFAPPGPAVEATRDFCCENPDCERYGDRFAEGVFGHLSAGYFEPREPGDACCPTCGELGEIE